MIISLSSDLSGGATSVTIPMETWKTIYVKFDDVPTDTLFFQGHIVSASQDRGAIFEFKNAKLTVAQ